MKYKNDDYEYFFRHENKQFYILQYMPTQRSSFCCKSDLFMMRFHV